MKRIMLLATVVALMAVMLVAMASAALAVPPAGTGDTGCEEGQTNAYRAIGFAAPADDATSDNPAGENDHVSDPAEPPYRDNPGEDAGGTGPEHGFDTSEDNTFEGPHCPEQ
jgi:hypothetical protein